MQGSAIRRIGYQRWSRNLAIGLGNAPHDAAVVAALAARAMDPSPLVREHVAWALARQTAKAGGAASVSSRTAAGSRPVPRGDPQR